MTDQLLALPGAFECSHGILAGALVTSLPFRRLPLAASSSPVRAGLGFRYHNGWRTLDGAKLA